VEFSAKLLPDGKIWFYYGDVNTSPDISWISGLSAGNNLDYYLMNQNNSGLKMNSTFSLELLDWPSWLRLESSGDLHGTPDKSGTYALPFKVTDWTGISSNKELTIKVHGGSSVQSNYREAGVQIWPNPVSDDLWLDGYCAQSGNLNFTIFDLTGRQVISRVYPVQVGHATIHCTDLENLKTGIYLFQLTGVLKAQGKLVKKE